MTAISRRLIDRPVDIASLAAFRILFGLMMFAAMVRFLAKGWVRELYVEPVFHFTYPGFHWVHPWPDFWMHAHFVALAIVALGIALGLFYRACAILFFLGFTYVELLDQTAYLNHYYLISLLSALLILLPAHRAWSFDAWRKPNLEADFVPTWCLNLLRFQVAIVYVFAGLAKFNADWLLKAQPLRIWLAARSDLPLLGPWLGQEWVAYAASWFGAIFDTTIVFFLLFGRTRRPAYLVLILFHIATWVLFNIGMFPWIMIVAATVLFPPDWPRYWLNRLGGQGELGFSVRSLFCLLCVPLRFSATSAIKLLNAENTRKRRDSQRRPDRQAGSLLHRYGLVLFLAAYVLVQLGLPLRPYFSGQPPSWTCSGFNCAWQVMIVEKTGYSEFYAIDRATGERHQINLANILTRRQKMMMDQDPYLIRDLALHLAADRRKENLEIHVDAFATLNGRPSQRMIKSDVNLAGHLPTDWITPLAPLTAEAHCQVILLLLVLVLLLESCVGVVVHGPQMRELSSRDLSMNL